MTLFLGHTFPLQAKRSLLVLHTNHRALVEYLCFSESEYFFTCLVIIYVYHECQKGFEPDWQMFCVWNGFFFCFPITSYNIFHFSSSLSLTHLQIASLSRPKTHTHTSTVSHLGFLPKTYRIHSFTLLGLINLSLFSPRPVASSEADGVQTIFWESERCCVFSISYSWALLAQVCVPGLACSGDAVADWMWINESVTFNSGVCCHRYGERERGRWREREDDCLSHQ